MKKILSLILIGIMCLTLIGCGKANELTLLEKSEYYITDDYVSFKIKEEGLTKEKATFILENHVEADYTYGNPYSLEKEKDGIWYEIEPINDMNFNMVGFDLKANEKVEIEIDWEYHYGSLNTGKYRVVKDIVYGEYKKKEAACEGIFCATRYVAAEFTIK